MSVRGTENFVYYTDKVLGAGSTGTVYFGRHKRKGDSCAIKIFAVSQGSNTKMQVRENELEFMRKLQHKNIVSLITIEKDSRTSEIAMVLELCTEGSLQKRLSEPEYVNGLPEEDFKEFIVQFADGLHYLRLYGIAHRDIKPGNILCTKTEDGRILYKITDFGSSRELFVHDKSKALYGTEEYLHPDVYRCIFIEKVSYGDEYEVRAELWSIGVTLYQVACGQLPFQALGGRNNRMKMYEIISRKGANVISGVQKENSQIQYSNTLPQTCVLSVGLQERITPLMRKLMEKDEQSQLKFDDFFPKIEELRSTILITVYCLASSSYVHVYVQPSGSLSDIQKIVERYTKISANSQIYLFNGRRLNDIVKDSEPVSMYPKTCERNPLILLVFSINLESIEFKPPFPPGLPSLSSDRNLASDATWSRDACAAVYRLSHITRSLSNMQMFTRQGRKWLVEVLSIDHNNAKKQFVELKSNYSLVIKNVEIAGTNLDRWIDNVLILMQKELKNSKNATQQVKDLCEKLARIKKNSQEKLNDLKAYVKRTDRLVVHIEEKVRNAEKITELTFEKAFSDCDAPRCPIKLVTYYTQARDTFEQFSKDKKRSLTYNEDQIHKYQRIKLEETLKLGLSVINQHCLPSISKLNDFFRIWFRDECSGPWNNISHLEVDLKKFHEECLKISNTMGKLSIAGLSSYSRMANIKLDTENEVKSLVNQMNLTLPTTSVPLTSRAQETSGYCTEPGLATDKQMEVYSETATVVPNLKNTLEKLYASASQNKELTENIIVDLLETDELVLRNEWKRGLANSRDNPGHSRDKYVPADILEEDGELYEDFWSFIFGCRQASLIFDYPTFPWLEVSNSGRHLITHTSSSRQSVLTPHQLKERTEMQGMKTPSDKPNKILEMDLKPDEDDSWDVDNLDDTKVSNSSSLMILAIELSLVSVIAEGSFSFVYKALHPSLGTVAYKKLPVQSVRKPEESRMIGEVQRLASLKHANIVQLLRVVFEPGNYGLVLEYMKYGDMSGYLHANKVGFTEKIKLLHDVASGMEYLHGQTPPIIHGDLKIQNVLVSKCKAAKICGFGLTFWKQYAQRRSEKKVLVDTVSHIPPKYWIDPKQRIDEKFDVYGFGILMWDILTQRQPFQGNSKPLISTLVVNGSRLDMTDVIDESKEIKQLMLSCWQQDPQSRPMFTVVAGQLKEQLENQKKDFSDLVQNTNVLPIDKVEMEKYFDEPWKKIGSGGYGTVYFGSSQDYFGFSLDIKVAIKNQTAKDRFSKEKSLASLLNPYIVPVLKFTEDPEKLMFPSIYMDVEHALNLNDVQKEFKNMFSWAEKLAIIFQICEGSQFLQTQKIHVDVKPTNIVLDGMRNARLGDSGLAVVLPQNQSHRSTADIGGTSGYVDPYKSSNDDKNKKTPRFRSDLFSFGIVTLQFQKWQTSFVIDTKNDIEIPTPWKCTKDTFQKIPNDEAYCDNHEFFVEEWRKIYSKNIDKNTRMLGIGRIDGQKATDIIANQLKDIDVEGRCDECCWGTVCNKFRCPGEDFVTNLESHAVVSLKELKLKSDSTNSMLLLGETGVAKSTFISNWRKQEKEENLLSHFESFEDTKIKSGDDMNEVHVAVKSAIKSMYAAVICMIFDPADIRFSKNDLDLLLKYLGNLEEFKEICILLKRNNARLSKLFMLYVEKLFERLYRRVERNMFYSTNNRNMFHRHGVLRFEQLGQLLQEITEIQQSLSNMDCIENETFSLFDTLYQDVELDKNNVVNKLSSWGESVAETNRICELNTALKPPGLKETISYNKVKEVITSSTTPKAKMNENFQANVEGEEGQIARNELSQVKQFYIPSIKLLPIQLQMPNLNKRCIYVEELTSRKSHELLHCLVNGRFGHSKIGKNIRNEANVLQKCDHPNTVVALDLKVSLEIKILVVSDVVSIEEILDCIVACIRDDDPIFFVFSFEEKFTNSLKSQTLECESLSDRNENCEVKNVKQPRTYNPDYFNRDFDEISDEEIFISNASNIHANIYEKLYAEKFNQSDDRNSSEGIFFEPSGKWTSVRDTRDSWIIYFTLWNDFYWRCTTDQSMDHGRYFAASNGKRRDFSKKRMTHRKYQRLLSMLTRQFRRSNHTTHANHEKNSKRNKCMKWFLDDYLEKMHSERKNSVACNDTKTTFDFNCWKFLMPDENITDQQNKDGFPTRLNYLSVNVEYGLPNCPLHNFMGGIMDACTLAPPARVLG